MLASKTEMVQSQQAHDGHYFKKRSEFEKKKLVDLAEITERHLEMDSTIPDECQGLLRSAAGKAKLLVNQKFKQFEDLIDVNLHPKLGELAVQVEDLAGFWDLMMIEVQSLYKTFSQIAEQSRNNWKSAINVRKSV